MTGSVQLQKHIADFGANVQQLITGKTVYMLDTEENK
jgi:hypothetical protein